MDSFKANLFISRITQLCRIQGEPVHTYNGTLEFIINHLRNINSSVRMSVKVADEPRNIRAMNDFLSKYDREPFVDVRAYVEFNPEVNFTNRVAESLHDALIAYTFKKECLEKLIQGIRIHSDLSYEFFDIDTEHAEE
jgi:hypothetical protein